MRMPELGEDEYLQIQGTSVVGTRGESRYMFDVEDAYAFADPHTDKIMDAAATSCFDFSSDEADENVFRTALRNAENDYHGRPLCSVFENVRPHYFEHVKIMRSDVHPSVGLVMDTIGVSSVSEYYNDKENKMPVTP